MNGVRARLAEGGRVVIPAEFRRAMGVEVGDEILLRLDDGEVRILTLDRAIRRAQELVRRYVPEGRSLVDELLAERREEVTREASGEIGTGRVGGGRGARKGAGRTVSGRP